MEAKAKVSKNILKKPLKKDDRKLLLLVRALNGSPTMILSIRFAKKKTITKAKA